MNGGCGAARTHRLVRRALIPALTVLAIGATGCATKADIRDVREDLSRLEARQDSIHALLRTQNRQVMESLTGATEQLLDVRGDLMGQLNELRDQLVQVSELTSQVQIRLNQLDQELAAVLRDGGVGAAMDPSRPGGGDDPDGGAGGDDAERDALARDMYEAGREQMARNNAETARRAFQMVADSFPEHPLAPEAQLQLGETFAMEGQYDAALGAFERVVQRYQDSDAAPRALYRAGVIAQERGQTDRAREYFRRVIAGYPRSDARRLAEDALERM